MSQRPGLITTQIDKKKLEPLLTEELNYVADLFKKNQFELRIAGGPVRDLLMDIVPADIDFASTATPTQMKEMFEAEGVRMLHKKGEEHGTITCRINDKENFEITTLRVDVVCDGRRAEVNFTTDWELDAFRRDLTVNSLFLGLDGTVYDFTGGIEDIKARNVRFVGDAVARIQEDYLRILRYFRFYGRIAKDSYNHSPETIKAIIDNKAGMANLSGERVWTELKRIVVGRFADDVMRCMLEECGLHEYLGLSKEAADVDEFARVFKSAMKPSGKVDIEPMTILSTCFRSREDIKKFHAKCKISNHERDIALFIVAFREVAAENKTNLAYFKELICDQIYFHDIKDEPAHRLRIVELMKYIDAYDLIEQFKTWELPRMPVTGKDMMNLGRFKGARMKFALKHLYNVWKKSDYKLEAEELLKFVDEPFEEPSSTGNKKTRIIGGWYERF